jgi:phosphoribosylformylglycinamidine (FGAM) synthase-like amidotransferase family enzyme
MNYCYTNYPIIVKAEGYNGYRKAGVKKASAYKTTATGTSNTSAKKSVDELAKEVIAGKWSAGDERKQKLTAAGYDYNAVQKRVNELMSKPKLKTVDEIAKEVIQGKWSAGDERKQKLTTAGYDYSKVQARVNELMKNQ